MAIRVGAPGSRSLRSSGSARSNCGRPRAGRAMMFEAIAEAESSGVHGATGPSAQQPRRLRARASHHAMADEYIPQAIEFCWPTTRISGTSTRSPTRPGTRSTAAVSRGRRHAGRSSRTRANRPGLIMRRSSCSPSSARAAVIPGPKPRSPRRAVGVPADDVDVHMDLAVARAEVAWLERRPNELDEATEGHDRRARRRRRCATRLALLAPPRGYRGDAPKATGAYALALGGDWAGAAVEWERTSVPVRVSLARLETGDEGSLRASARRRSRSSARSPRLSSRCGVCGPRRAWADARAPEGHTGERGRPDAARDRGARARRGGLPQRADRGSAVSLAAHRGSPRLVVSAEARRRVTRRGGRGCPATRAPRRPVTPPPKHGNSTDAARGPPAYVRDFDPRTTGDT